MPAADLSGEVFSLNADAAYEGLVTARAGAGAQLGVTVEAEACHGLSLEASASAMAQANASFGFLLAARGTGFGRASAGLAAKAQLNPDIFDRFGLILEAAAAAEASAGGRLSVGLDFAEISRFAEDHLDGLALQLFLAFLEEIVLEAGLWARIAAAAMVAAHADITVSLKDDADAGLLIEAGAAAGLAAGAGFDFFAAARFDDVRRFYGRSVRLITKEASKRLRQVLPMDLKWAAEIVELALPMALQTVYDLGQTSSLASLTPERLIEPLLAAFSQTGRTYVVDKAIDAVPELLELLVDRLVDAINDNEFDFDRDELERPPRAPRRLPGREHRPRGRAGRPARPGGVHVRRGRHDPPGGDRGLAGRDGRPLGPPPRLPRHWSGLSPRRPRRPQPSASVERPRRPWHSTWGRPPRSSSRRITTGSAAT